MRLTLAAALAATTTLALGPLHAQEFGDYGYDTIRSLAFDYAGRYTGSEKFEAASDYMTSRLGYGGGTVTRQNFTSTGGPSHNLLREIEGRSGKFIVVGAHFDTAGTFDNLQGVDDNASGAALLTELAAHMSGMEMETGIVFNAFGAEEIGLQGSRYYVENLTADQRANIAGMVNIDSLITGDHMYAHAGTNYLTNAELKSYWTRIHAIADELDIDLRSNPGKNEHYPVDTGCCSDGASFEGLDIPVLWLEATNWDLGDLDGYTQTDNPAIPGGSTWHTPDLDRWDVLTDAFGQERIPGRLYDYALLMTRLLVEETGADLIASAQNAGVTASQLADLTTTQQDDASAYRLRSARDRLQMPGEIGRFTPLISVEGLSRAGGTSDLGTDRGGALAAHVGGFWQQSEELSFGTMLSYQHSGNDLDAGGDLSSKALTAAVDVAWQRDATWAVAAISYGKTDLLGDRDFTMTSGLGVEILRRNFDVDTDSHSLGASIHGGYQMGASGGLNYGPVVGLDYRSTRIAAFSEGGSDRRRISYAEQDFDSLELQLGGQVSQHVQFGAYPITLAGQASYVRELADGRPTSATVTDSAGNSSKIGMTGADDSFGRIGLSAQMQLSPQAVGWVSLDGRVGHNAGSQTALGAGLGMRF